MSKDFSNAPLVVDDVTIKPTWPWSRQYRAEVTSWIRASARSSISPEESGARYAAWYAEEHGLTLKEARERIEG